MKKLILFFVLVLAAFFSQAQRNCGSMDYLEQQLQNDPKRNAKLEMIERHTEDVIASGIRAVNGVITIPVVVHVVYNTTAENVSNAQIQSQIDVLNADFRRLNSDADNTWSQASDVEIAFCLASVDPSGNPTTGITRTSTSVTAFGTNDQVKFNSSGGKDAWPSSQYMNLWVCDISGGILGYAQFPGGSSSTDGVVIDYQYFGTTGTATAPFNLGRTATHEVGHWLNLRHIWGDGGCSVDDFVTDTPTSDAANYGCPLGHVSCSTVDMVQNYMDYTDDACMNLFTTGQKTRMRALFEPGGSRASLLTSTACGGGGPAPTCNDGIQNGTETGVDCGGSCPACGCSDNAVSLSITFDNYPEETSWAIRNSSNTVVANGGTYGSQADGSTLNIPLCLPDGCYTLTFTDAYGDGMCCSYGNGSYTLSGASGTLASGGTFTASQVSNFCVGGSPAPTCSDGIQNGDETGVDCGGSNCAPCGGGGCTYGAINSNTFESSLGIWVDGGTDCARINSTTYAYSGSYSMRLRDNTNSSVMSTTNQNWSNYEEVTVSFKFRTNSFENGEDFWVQLSTNGGSTYSTKATYAAGTNFSNGTYYQVDLVLAGPFTTNTRLRFRADASADDDQLYLDDVVITGCLNGARMDGSEPTIAPIVVDSPESIASLSVYPNPADALINFSYVLAESGMVTMFVTDIQGRLIDTRTMSQNEGHQVISYDLNDLDAGTYLVSFVTDRGRQSARFVVFR
ncbi:MAG: hypothetical protein RL226_1249 [Bacteroidota bacterium]